MKIHFSIIEFLYVVILITSYLFLHHTTGLGYDDGDRFKYVTEIHSSGSDDDVFAFLTGTSALFFFLISIFIKRKYYVLGIALSFINFSYILPQAGDYIDTIENGNFILLFLVSATVLLNILFVRRIILYIKNALF
ncbi:hypothetical protein [Faecalibacter bovis]|uniref:Uncharacterized protein n=1 Tax=Faecalibacter bovis TaxID=2898187 RepID=A0ABX7XA35_9FLAO|nr:hypothetical protein [Faecalibacter bovis]QTV04748.1 hypothetical protein J9309_08000 [Faecalibacter bovis]